GPVPPEAPHRAQARSPRAFEREALAGGSRARRLADPGRRGARGLAHARRIPDDALLVHVLLVPRPGPKRRPLRRDSPPGRTDPAEKDFLLSLFSVYSVSLW